MNSRTTLVVGLIAAIWPVISAAQSPARPRPAFPLAASADGRYLVDASGRPFFYHADTAWCAVKKLTLAEFEAYLDRRVSDGFTAVHLHAMTKEQGPVENLAGEAPFVRAAVAGAPEGHDAAHFADDLTRPNEPYWRHFDAMLAAVERRGLLAVVSTAWIRWGGKDRDGWRWQLREDTADRFGEFLGSRYRRHQNLLWIVGGDANPIERTAAVARLARAIKRAAPHHLLTVHNRPEYASAAFFAETDWLDVNMAYSYHETYVHVLGEWNRLGKRRPIVLGESGYEEESNDSRGGAPWRVRRQAYGALLSGAVAGHAFGQKHVWRMDAEWKTGLDSPGSTHMQHLGALFASLPWHRLEPDQDHRLVVSGFGFFGDPDYVTAARTADGAAAIVYFPKARTVTLDRGALRSGIAAHWVDPTTGARTPLDLPAAGGGQAVTPPAKNAAGDEDWVLVFAAS